MTKVFFYFPDNQATHFSLEMHAVPRIGDEISFGARTPNDFETVEAYKMFVEEEYAFRQWKVDTICWLFDGPHYQANIELIEIKGLETAVDPKAREASN